MYLSVDGSKIGVLCRYSQWQDVGKRFWLRARLRKIKQSYGANGKTDINHLWQIEL